MVAEGTSRGGSSGIRRAAFFDLDETLISTKSIFGFLEFHLAQRGLPPAVYRRIRADLDKLTAAGWTREDTNQRLYRVYAGQPVSRVAAQGRAWFAAELASGTLFVEEVLSALRWHSNEGDLVVLVSGSFSPCVEPVARHVGADLVACTSPEIVDGVYTGRVDRPVIGQGKAEAAQAILTEHQISAEDSFAYGDHDSDLPMLRSVGHPVVVGENPVLIRLAEKSGWRRLEGPPRSGSHPGTPPQSSSPPL